MRHSQHSGRIHIPVSTGQHNQHSVGTINPLAPSLVWPSQHSGTITSPAQSSFHHSPTSERARPGQHTVNPSLCTVSTSLPPQLLQILSAGVCIWTTHRRQFLLKADATRVSFSSFSVSTVGSILMHIGCPQEYFLLCRSCPSEGAWWAVLECQSCRSVDYASLFIVPEC